MTRPLLIEWNGEPYSYDMLMWSPIILELTQARVWYEPIGDEI